MRSSKMTLALAGLALTAPLAWAQSGQLDQQSPHNPNSGTGAQFNADASFLVWQQQIRAGISGTLEGLTITFGQGTVGAQFTLRIRDGAAPSSNPVLFETNVVRTSSATWEDLFINMTSSNITVTAGQPFVMEIVGQGQGTWIIGSYQLGNPLYPEPLYLTGTPFADGGWRLGFDSYVMVGGCEADFNGDNQVDFFDYLDFASAFDAEDDSADFNGDNQVDFFDYLDFVAAFDNCQ
jgi:hypothetical protein